MAKVNVTAVMHLAATAVTVHQLHGMLLLLPTSAIDILELLDSPLAGLFLEVIVYGITGTMVFVVLPDLVMLTLDLIKRMFPDVSHPLLVLPRCWIAHVQD